MGLGRYYYCGCCFGFGLGSFFVVFFGFLVLELVFILFCQNMWLLCDVIEFLFVFFCFFGGQCNLEEVYLFWLVIWMSGFFEDFWVRFMNVIFVFFKCIGYFLNMGFMFLRDLNICVVNVIIEYGNKNIYLKQVMIVVYFLIFVY